MASGSGPTVSNLVGEIRRSSVLMTYAPGAVIDMRADMAPISGVSAGLEEWDSSAPPFGNLADQKIVERRLCKKLGKRYFRLPPVVGDDDTLKDGTPDPASLVMTRFPRWLQCPKCDRIRPASKWHKDPGRPYRYCKGCTDKEPGQRKVFAVPVRFVTACARGHLDDFPWDFWVRHKTTCKQRGDLRFASEGPGLAGLILSCPSCHASRSMDGAFGGKALTGLTCHGERPWLRADDADCACTGDSATYRVLQRGASNLYYPVVESALDIPPWTEHLETLIGDFWDDLEAFDDVEQRAAWIRRHNTLSAILEREGLSAEKVSREFDRMQAQLASLDPSDLRTDEYRVFTAGGRHTDREFEMDPTPVPKLIDNYISGIGRIARLREVRVVCGFTRITPPSGDAESMAPLSVTPLDWLPALEIRGEGVFLDLHGDRLLSWERNPDVLRQCEPLAQAWEGDWSSRHGHEDIPFALSPRWLLVHTFAHAVIRQLTLECGYSTASLRERIYVSEGSDGMAGVLIYTGTADSDGTLGGLQGRARTDLIGQTVVGAIAAAEWCSSDPLCIGGEMAAPDTFSGASCHSCTMVPETSCEWNNRFLDRTVLVGTDERPALGYFRPLASQGH